MKGALLTGYEKSFEEVCDEVRAGAVARTLPAAVDTGQIGKPERFIQYVLSVTEHHYLDGQVTRMQGARRMASRGNSQI
jgi:hypothetical protein